MKRRCFLSLLGGTLTTALFQSGCTAFDTPCPVGLVKAFDYNLETLETLFSLHAEKCGFPAIRGKRVVVKPNSVEYRPGQPINTHPQFIRALVRFLKRHAPASITIAEGPGHQRDTEEIWRINGYHALAREEKVLLRDLNFDSVIDVPFKTVAKDNYLHWLTPSRLTTMAMPQTVVESEVLISVPKLKCHHWTGVTLAMKNMFGIIPGMVYGWPKNILHWNDINRSIVEINRTFPIHFSFVDGIEAMEGDGPLSGTRRAQNTIIMGANAMAVDVVSALVMGLNPGQIPYLQLARFLGMGPIAESGIQVVGESMDALRYDFKLPEGFESLRR